MKVAAAAPEDPLFSQLEQLDLKTFAQGLRQTCQEDPSWAEQALPVLRRLVDQERACRLERTVARRLKGAGFVQTQTVDAFDFEYNPSTRKIKKRYLRLLEADPVSQNVGAIFCGQPGLGKTHLARALGFASCQRTHRVLFVPCSRLLNELAAAQGSGDLEHTLRKFTSPALLILDELGYLSLSSEEAGLFFQVVSRRHDAQRPTVLTTNKPFKEWNQVFHGDATAHAIVDRLTEKSEIFYLEGESYRKRHRKGLDGRE
jgi:DNA replication protein DnaC